MTILPLCAFWQDIAEKQLRAHVVEEHKAHSYKFSCPHCHKRFPVKGHIKRHIRSYAVLLMYVFLKNSKKNVLQLRIFPECFIQNIDLLDLPQPTDLAYLQIKGVIINCFS